MTRRSLLLLFVCSLIVAACVRDRPDDLPEPTPEGIGKRVFIANEGSLGNGNASLSVYEPETGGLFNKVFAGANQEDLGDILQSMALVGDRLFLSVNNSDQVKVIDKHTFRLVGNIHVRKPRELLWINDTKLYVSSLFHPDITIVNPSDYQVTGKISVDFPNTEGLLLHQGKVYAANWDTACSYLYEIDPQSDAITARIPIAGSAPSDVLADREGMIWVLSGNIHKGKKAVFTRLDPKTRTILQSLSFPENADIIKPRWNPTKDTLYFLGVNYEGRVEYNGLFRMSIHAEAVPTTPLVAARPLQYFWGLGIDSAHNHIFLGDPKGFIQNGDVWIYTPDGAELRRLSVNLGPGAFLFE